MSTPDTPEGDGFVPVATVEDAREDCPMPVQADGRSIGLFHHEDAFYATDLRCPHMGFPLTDGSVDDGILTCPWHHARFEISCGDTFDPFADDVATYPVLVREGAVYVDPDPDRDVPPVEHWSGRLDHGLEEDIGLVVAKAVIGLDDAGEEYTTALRIGTEFGTRYRRMGWGRGLTTLAVMANLLPALRPEDRRRALYAGLTTVADEVAGEAPAFDQAPLGTSEVEPDRLKRWFRDTVDVRDADGAERVLRAAVAADLPRSDVVGMLAAAATDHLYLDGGHRLDFVNKAFETLDHVGWTHADDVLASQVPGLTEATRAEEVSAWRQPIDLAALCFEAADELPELLESGSDATWSEPDDFLETLLGDDPRAITDALTGAIATGATATELAQVVTAAGARRIVQFGTANEFRDWDSVHHTYTYANAVWGLSRRTDHPEIYRGLFDAAMAVYLDRFLNTPPAPLPEPTGGEDPDAVLENLRETFDVESDDTVDQAGRLTAEYLESGGDAARLKRHLGEVLLREDVGFHTRQNLEAAFTQYDDLRDSNEARAREHLVGTARYLAAHTPTRRAGEQTFRIAERLHRGEKIHEA